MIKIDRASMKTLLRRVLLFLRDLYIMTDDTEPEYEYVDWSTEGHRADCLWGYWEMREK